MSEPTTTPAERATEPAPSRSTRSKPRGASVFVASGVTAVWAAVVSFVPMLALVVLAWLVGGQGSGNALSALRFAGAGWLLAHAVPVGTSSGPVSITPLALTALVVWRLVKAGRHTARAVGGNRQAALSGALGIAVGYGVIAALAALLVSGSDVHFSALRALWTAGLIALVSAAAGGIYESGMGAHVAGQLSPPVRAGLRGGVVAVLGLLALGSLTVGAALAVRASEAADALSVYQAGAIGDIGLSLLCLAYAPNLAVWAVAYLAGPGFAVGTDTSVGIAYVHLGPVPAIPVLAGLPTHALPQAGTLLLAVPLVLGGVIGLLLAYWCDGGVVAMAGASAVAGVCCGALTTVLGMLSGGSLGAGRLATIGPVAWQLGATAAVLITLGALASSLGARVLNR